MLVEFQLTGISPVVGSINEETKAVFVSEVERVGRDPVYWVRREACFAVGALAKVVPQEVVISSLVSTLCHYPSIVAAT